MINNIKLVCIDLAKTLWLCAKQAFRPAVIATFIATSGFIVGFVIFGLIPTHARDVIGYTMAQNSPVTSDTPPFLISFLLAYWAIFKITYILAFTAVFAAKTGAVLAQGGAEMSEKNVKIIKATVEARLEQVGQAAYTVGKVLDWLFHKSIWFAVFLGLGMFMGRMDYPPMNAAVRSANELTNDLVGAFIVSTTIGLVLATLFVMWLAFSAWRAIREAKQEKDVQG